MDDGGPDQTQRASVAKQPGEVLVGKPPDRSGGRLVVMSLTRRCRGKTLVLDLISEEVTQGLVGIHGGLSFDRQRLVEVLRSTVSAWGTVDAATSATMADIRDTSAAACIRHGGTEAFSHG